MARLWSTLLVAVTVGFAGPAVAQESWPDRPLKIILGFPAGSGVDIVTRLVADKLGRDLDQTVVVEPHAGAGGNVGTGIAAKAPPDGYNFYMGTTGTQVASTALYHDLPLDPRRDFVPITPVCDVPHVLIVPNSLPVHTLKDFIGYLRANPGKVNYASSGNGSAMHLTTEQFKVAAHVELIHVPYRVSTQAVADLIGGQVQAMMHQVPAVIGQVHSGLFRSIAVTSAQRLPALPEIPTFAESGLPGFESSTWMGLFAPAGTPAPVIARMNRVLVAAIAGELGPKLEALGTVPRGTTPDAFQAEIESEVVKWSAIIEAAHIKVD